ncbi:C2H2 type zinc-finger-domain-containing protein [Chytriomyces sp. MP71]|nr:C2H2 type zinc-finger-domain-containing protein [Chytriomyces sp. MP71]
MNVDEAETASQFSEQTATTTTTVAAGNASGTVPMEGAIFTCLACHVAFRSADNQRDHYRSDWHRYNLKRKVAELPPVTMDNFAQRLSAQAAKSNEDAAKQSFNATCQVCRKTYSSENGYANHITSKKHKEAQVAWDKAQASGAALKMQAASDAPGASAIDDSAAKATPATPWRIQLASARTEEELNAVIDSKIAAAVRLDPAVDCLFCETHKSTSVEENVDHMAKVHSFFVPDLEYLVDMEGLLRYLGEKISVGNVCIFCNGKGRALHSLEAVRKHMIDKGHCKIEYENGGELEVGDFYDFSSTWQDDEDAEDDDGNMEWEDLDEDAEEAIVAKRSAKKALMISEDGMQLTLPSGQVILNKKAHVIRVPKNPLPQSLAITRAVAANYAAMDVVAIRSRITTMAIEREARKQNRIVNRGYQEFRAKVGISSNKSTANQHFRSQIGFD